MLVMSSGRVDSVTKERDRDYMSDLQRVRIDVCLSVYVRGIKKVCEFVLYCGRRQRR